MSDDDLTVLGDDGIRRSFDEHYDTMMDVEQDPTGAMWAIQKQVDRIAELERQLADVTAERDRLGTAIKRQAGAAKNLRQSTLAEVQHIKDNERKEYVATRSLDSERDANAILTDEIETAEQRVATLEAMLPRAYRAGVEAGADTFKKTRDRYIMGPRTERANRAQEQIIRALPTPTIEQLKEMLKENGDESINFE